LLSQEVNATKQKTDFKGLTGGINFVISKGFLDAPKSVKEIHGELKKEGYHLGKNPLKKYCALISCGSGKS
jgi:hypothetical protein